MAVPMPSREGSPMKEEAGPEDTEQSKFHVGILSKVFSKRAGDVEDDIIIKDPRREDEKS
jgi:hypothetical protein